MLMGVLLNLLNELGGKDKILSGFPIVFDKFNRSKNASFYLSNDSKITFYSRFLHQLV